MKLSKNEINELNGLIDGFTVRMFISDEIKSLIKKGLVVPSFISTYVPNSNDLIFTFRLKDQVLDYTFEVEDFLDNEA